MHSSLLDLQHPETTAKEWLEFIQRAMSSDLYLGAIKLGLNAKEAASVVLLDEFFSTLDPDQKKYYLQNEEAFEESAKEFVGIMEPFRYKKGKDYDASVRKEYMGMLKKLLKAHKNEKHKYEFIRTLVKFTSSSSYIMHAYTMYKNFYEMIKERNGS